MERPVTDTTRGGAQLRALPGGAVGPTGRPSSSDDRIDPELLKLTNRDRQGLLGQLAILLDSGIQVPAALQAMCEQTTSPRQRQVLEYMAGSVQSGQALSHSMGAMPRAFPVIVEQMVAAGEEAGELSAMLLRLVEMLEAESELRTRLRSALMYPSIMVIVATAVVVFLITAIIPRFKTIFAGRESVLPVPTKVLMALGDFFSTNGPWLFPLVILFLLCGFFYLKSQVGRPVLDFVLLRMPVLGHIYRLGVLSRTSRTLGTLLQAGVAIRVALDHTRGVAGSPAYEELWRSVHGKVGNGVSISESIRDSDLLPVTYKQMINAGESTASLDRVLLKISGHYATALQQKVRDLTTVIEPVLVVAMGGIVGFIALSIMLPIFRLSRIS
jgi:type IV pilus assembly protein PilC